MVNEKEIKDLEKRIDIASEKAEQDRKDLDSLSEIMRNMSADEFLGIKDLGNGRKSITIDGETIEFDSDVVEFTKLTEENTDEEIDKVISKYDIEFKQEVKRQDKIDLANILLEQEAIIKNIELAQEQFSKEMAVLNKELEELTSEFTREKFISILTEKKNIFSKYGKIRQVDEVQKLIDEILDSTKLDTMYNKLITVKNKQKILDRYTTDFNTEYAKFFNKLASNKKYKFVCTPYLLTYVVKNYGLEKDDAMLFLYTFFGFVHGTNTVNQYNIFINEVIKNLAKPSLLTEEERKELKDAMVKIIEYVRN